MYKAQYAFNMSMIMCPAVHIATRSLLRSSSTHEPSDPLSRVKITLFYTLYSLDVNAWAYEPQVERANMKQWVTLAKSFRNQQHARRAVLRAQSKQSRGKYQGFWVLQASQSDSHIWYVSYH